MSTSCRWKKKPNYTLERERSEQKKKNRTTILELILTNVRNGDLTVQKKSRERRKPQGFFRWGLETLVSRKQSPSKRNPGGLGGGVNPQKILPRSDIRKW